MADRRSPIPDRHFSWNSDLMDTLHLRIPSQEFTSRMSVTPNQDMEPLLRQMTYSSRSHQRSWRRNLNNANDLPRVHRSQGQLQVTPPRIDRNMNVTPANPRSRSRRTLLDQDSVPERNLPYEVDWDYHVLLVNLPEVTSVREVVNGLMNHPRVPRGQVVEVTLILTELLRVGAVVRINNPSCKRRIVGIMDLVIGANEIEIYESEEDYLRRGPLQFSRDQRSRRESNPPRRTTPRSAPTQFTRIQPREEQNTPLDNGRPAPETREQTPRTGSTSSANASQGRNQAPMEEEPTGSVQLRSTLEKEVAKLTSTLTSEADDEWKGVREGFMKQLEMKVKFMAGMEEMRTEMSQGQNDLNQMLEKVTSSFAKVEDQYNTLKEKKEKLQNHVKEHDHALPASVPLDEFPLHDLECQVCYGIMKGKIFLCAEGHCICEDCYPKVNNCPYCRTELGRKAIRNRLLEEFARRIVHRAEKMQIESDTSATESGSGSNESSENESENSTSE